MDVHLMRNGNSSCRGLMRGKEMPMNWQREKRLIDELENEKLAACYYFPVEGHMYFMHTHTKPIHDLFLESNMQYNLGWSLALEINGYGWKRNDNEWLERKRAL